MTMTTYGDGDASTVLIQMVDDHDLDGMELELTEICKRTEKKFCLIALKVQNWNVDLSPWKAPAVFGKEDFGDGAKNTLAEILTYCTNPEHTYILGGYSLAGLFALWAAYQTDRFTGIAAASPSIWFPGFVDYMKEHHINTDSVYLSLGEKEERTRNPMMTTVGNRIREAHERLKEQGIHTTLEWNPGNHFRDTHMRTARAFSWTLLLR